MHQSWTNFLLQCVIGACLLRGSGHPTCVAQQRPAAEPPAIQKHGLPEILTQQLFGDRKFEMLLRSAEAGRDRDDSELMRESLLLVLAHSHDVFEFSAASESATSLRTRALNLLMQSPPKSQRAWVDALQIIAAQELKSAIRSGGRHEAAGVARRYPLTEAGIQAEVIDMTCELLKGDTQRVVRKIQQLERMYSGTVLQAELQRQLRPLKARMDDLTDEDKKTGEALLSVSSSASSGTIAPPWPRPLWTWREKIWSFPGVPRPETGYLLYGCDPEASNHIQKLNNWRPVFWNSSVIIRTPFRIVALDRASGLEAWSVPTDTFKPQSDTTYDELENTTRRMLRRSYSADDEVSPIYGMAEFGLMSTDSDFLYFVDRFSFFAGGDPFLDNAVGRMIRIRNGFPIIEEEDGLLHKPVASRLIALRRGHNTIPTVAWQIGEGDQFQYAPVETIDMTSEAHTGVNSGAVDPARDALSESDEGEDLSTRHWEGHRFLSPPTGQGTRLFILTQNDMQLFLNCLQRNTGELLWRQPLAFADDNPTAFVNNSIFTKRTSTCIVSGETIVCSLADGIIIGVGTNDGTLKWATAIRDHVSLTPQLEFGRSMSLDETPIVSPSILVPCISDGIVVCSNHASTSLYGLSLETGEILWKSSRRAFGGGEVGGSPDYYVAGICGDQVILVGDRHCRSVKLDTGAQKWVVQIAATSGRGECRGDRFIIPMRYGQAVAVNLLTGTLIPESIVDPPENSIDQFGAIASDDELICVATPTSIAAFPRVDMLLKNTDQLPALTANPAKRFLIQAQAHLISGNVEASLSLLKEAVAARNSDSSPLPQIDEFLGELILQQWGRAIGARKETFAELSPKQFTLPAEEIPRDAGLLHKLQLTADMKFRARLFQRLSTNPGDRQFSELANLKQNRDWKNPIKLTNTWSIRSELLSHEPSIDLTGDMVQIDEFSIEELRQLVGHFLRHPEMLQNFELRQRLAHRLITRGQFAAAELFLVRWCEAATVANDTSHVHAFDLLRHLHSLRGTDVFSDPSTKPNEDAEGKNPDLKSQKSGITSALLAPLLFELSPFIRQPDADVESTRRDVWTDVLPAHCRMNSYLSGPEDTFGKLVSIDPLDGSIRDQVTLPFPISTVAGRFVPLADGELTPRMFPVCSTDQIAMLSCPIPGEAEVLWTRHFRNGEQDSHRVEFGALGSDHFIWQFGDELHCSDPLTGDDLWTQKRTLSQSGQITLDRGTSPSVRRIVGDRLATLVMGSDSRSYERFKTRDGRLLGSGRLAIGKSDSVVTVGRCLLYTDANDRLHLFDSASGKDELEDDEPILPLSRNGKIICQVLENNRVLIVSATLELILVDVDHGRIIFNTPGSTFVRLGFVYSVSAFERHGRLFVALSQDGRPQSEIQRGFQRGAPHLFDGPLLCLNQVTGEVQWSINVEHAIFPDLHGDPTDLMVSWSAPEPALESHAGFGSEDKLVVQVFDENTGQLIAQSPVYSSLPPLRCVHLADTRQIQLTTPNATISIRAPLSE